MRSQTPGPQGPPQDNAPNMNIASISTAQPVVQQPPQAPPQQQQPQQMQHQDFQPNQQQYFNQGPYRNQTPGPDNYRQNYQNRQFNNYNPNYRSRSQNFNPGYRRYQDYDRRPRYNDGRRSGYGNRNYQQNGYDRSYSRNRYYQNDNYNRNRNDQGQGDYRRKRSYYNNTQDNEPQHGYDRSTSRNGMTYQQQIEGITQTIRQHQQQEKQQGLGNDGFQGIHPSVLLASLDARNDQPQPHPNH